MYLFRRIAPHILGAIGFCFAISLLSYAADASDWKERLFTEAPSKWAALEQYYSKMEVSFRKIFAIPAEGKPAPLAFVGTLHQDVRVNGDMIVCITHRVGKDVSGNSVDTTSARCANLRYVFDLEKTAPNADNYILSDFEPISDKLRRKILYGSGGSVFRASFEGTQFGRLSDIIKDRRFTITNIHGVQQQGKEAVQFEYDFREETSDKQAASQAKEPWAEHGVVIVDPEHCWCIMRTHFDNPNWTGGDTVEYGDDMDGFPILHSMKHTSTHKHGMGNRLVIHEFDKFVHRDVPESEFTLSAFGLPEMQVPGEQKPRTLWRWLIGIGIALGAIAVLVRRYAKKRQMQQRA